MFESLATLAIGGNGRQGTCAWRPRSADELDLNGSSPGSLADSMPVIAQRCEELERDPSTFAVSVHAWQGSLSGGGQRRVDRLAGYRTAGARIIALDPGTTTSDEALASFADDRRVVGVDLSSA